MTNEKCCAIEEMNSHFVKIYPFERGETISHFIKSLLSDFSFLISNIR